MKSTRLPSWIESALGLEPLPAPPHVFAVDAERVSYARFDVGRGGPPPLLEARAVELDPGVIGGGALGGGLRHPEKLRDGVERLLGGAGQPIDTASLVLPDDWLRMTFLETGHLPVAIEARDEVVRWQLKRVVPLRVEDLRIDVQEVDPLPGGEGEHRVLVAFALEALLAGLEDLLADRGIRLGAVTSRSAAVLSALRPAIEDPDLMPVVVAEPSQYTLLFVRRGEPILFRHKALAADASLASREAAVIRDLRLTRAFLAERLPAATLGDAVLVAGADDVAPWSDWLQRGFGVGARRFDPIGGAAGGLGGEASLLLAAMSGAASQEIH